MKRYKKFFTEKVSDVDNVRDRAIEEFRSHSKNRSFQIDLRMMKNVKYSIYLYKNKPEKENIKITFHFGNYKNSEFKATYPNRWDIFITTKDYEDDIKYDPKTKKSIHDDALEEIESTLVHEITHASQEINGALHSYDFWNTPQAKTDKEKYGIHATKPTEQEAVLIEFLFDIQQNRFKKAFEELDYRQEYFRYFDFQDFVKKAYSIGIDKNEIIEFQQYSLKEINNKIKNYLDVIIDDNDYQWYVKLILGCTKDIRMIFSDIEFKKHLKLYINDLEKIPSKYPEVKENKEDYKGGLETIKKFKQEYKI